MYLERAVDNFEGESIKLRVGFWQPFRLWRPGVLAFHLSGFRQATGEVARLSDWH